MQKAEQRTGKGTRNFGEQRVDWGLLGKRRGGGFQLQSV